MKKIIIAMLFASACASSADHPTETKTEMPAISDAQAALTENAELFHKILESKGQDPTQALVAGQPLPVISIHADELSKFDAKSDVAPLFHKTRERWFPLFGANGDALASVTLVNEGGKWTLVRAGAPTLTHALVAARAAMPAGADEVGLVRVKELGVDFLATGHGDDLTLIPLYDNDELHLRARTLQPAATVMAQLAPAAQRAGMAR